MKIAFFSTYLFGGAGSSARSVVSVLREKGHSVHLYYRFGVTPQSHEHCLDFWYSNDQINKTMSIGVKNLFYHTSEETCVKWTQIERTMEEKPDVILLFWYAQMLSPELIQQLYIVYKCPIVLFM